MARATRVPLAMVALLLTACDGPGVVAPQRHSAAIGGSRATLNTAIVGAWQRTVFFFDDFGFAHSVETTWRFGPDGTAVRATVTRNLSAGIGDVVLTTARWRLEGDVLFIDFTAPSPGSVQFNVRVQGNQLLLAGQVYFRIVE